MTDFYKKWCDKLILVLAVATAAMTFFGFQAIRLKLEVNELQEEKNYWLYEAQKQAGISRSHFTRIGVLIAENEDLRQQLNEIYFSTYCYEEDSQ